MSEPMKCKYCGAAADIRDGMIFGQCGTWQVLCSGVVYRNSLCERDALRKRIDAAVKALQDITRQEIEPDDVVCVFATEVADVVKILTGNSPTIPESSEG